MLMMTQLKMTQLKLINTTQSLNGVDAFHNTYHYLRDINQIQLVCLRFNINTDEIRVVAV